MPHTRPEERTPGWFAWSAAAIVLFALATRLVGLDLSLGIDEAGSVDRALSGHLWETMRADVHPPLFFLLLGAGLKVTRSYAALRLFSVACGVGLVACVLYFWRRRPEAALLFAMVLAGLPGLIRHSVELRPYALLFLLLALALVLSLRIFESGGSTRDKAALAAVLVCAALSHVETVFFAAALAPVLAWPARRRGLPAILGALLPLAPALVLDFILVRFFLMRPGPETGGWWVPHASLPWLYSTLKEATGGAELDSFASAVGRHFPFGHAAAAAAPLAAAGVLLWAALSGIRPRSPCLALAACGSLYFACLLAYSAWGQPIVLERTLMPGLIALAGAGALAVGGSRSRRLRVAAISAAALLLLVMDEQVVHAALLPSPGLRGMAATAQSRLRAGDQFLLFKGMDLGLRAYWPGLEALHPINVDQSRPIAPQVEPLRARLSGTPCRWVVAYREDYYLDTHAPEMAAIRGMLTGSGLTLRQIFDSDGLVLLEADP